MGEHSHIIVQSANLPASIVLYGHWAGRRNISTTLKAKNTPGVRFIGDPAYLAASLFHLFSTHPRAGYDGITGYGIWSQEDVSPDMLDADWPPVYVNADTGEFRLDEPYEFPSKN